jgi:hypothetical protein
VTGGPMAEMTWRPEVEAALQVHILHKWEGG